MLPSCLEIQGVLEHFCVRTDSTPDYSPLTMEFTYHLCNLVNIPAALQCLLGGHLILSEDRYLFEFRHRKSPSAA